MHSQDKKSYFCFKHRYLLAAILLFIIEIIIALYFTDEFVRPFVGDFLVVILLYLLMRAFVNLDKKTCAVIVLVFAFAIELLQWFNIVEILGLSDNKIASTLIGTSFSVGDLIAYLLGVITVLVIDNRWLK